MAAMANMREQVTSLLMSSPEGLTDAMLRSHFGEESMTKGVLPALNFLMQGNRLNSTQLEAGGILFTLVEEEVNIAISLYETVAVKLQGLSPEMMMVYHEIERSGTNGISSGDIKKKTNIQQNTVTKATKELDRRSLIKRVKSIHQKTQKIWMLMDLVPSATITGGPWYTDNDFDHEFVNEICKIAESQIKEEWESQGVPTSLQAVEKRVGSSGVSQEALSIAHIKQIVNRLIFDCKVEEVSVAYGPRFSDPGPYYRSAAQGISHFDSFTSMPCGVCPVFDQCQPGGVISPESCVYMDQWWTEDDVLEGGEVNHSTSMSLGNQAAPEIEDLMS